jgi:hypothetical protein
MKELHRARKSSAVISKKDIIEIIVLLALVSLWAFIGF